MGYPVTEGRARELKGIPGQYKIGNIFSGPDSKEKITYPGDRGILFPDSLCIQVRKVKLVDEQPPMRLNGKVLYTLGVHYPPELAHSFVGMNK